MTDPIIITKKDFTPTLRFYLTILLLLKGFTITIRRKRLYSHVAISHSNNSFITK